MANNYDTIRNMLMAAVDVPAVLSGKVIEVDTEARTANIDVDGTTLPGVLLQPIIDNSTGIVIFPKVGATALCTYNAEYDGWILLQASDIDHIDIAVGDTSLSVSTDGIVINNGNNGGLVNVNTLKSAFNAVVTDITAIYTALKGLGVPLVQTSASLSDIIEDNSVKH